MANIHPAATVVLVRDGLNGLETLLLKRSETLAFAAGSWVFPGGRIDPEDYSNNPDDVESAARRAGVRETQEEAGLLISEDNLVYFSHWVTPEFSPRRFATWFFITDINDNSDDVVVDDGEIVEYQWCRPEYALARHRAKQLDMMPPTFVILTELMQCQTVAQSLLYYGAQTALTILPKLTKTDQGVAMLYPGDSGYEQADQEAAGARNRLWVSDAAWRYEKYD